MSRVSRSGRSRSTSAIACSPLAAMPTTSISVVLFEEPGERGRVGPRVLADQDAARARPCGHRPARRSIVSSSVSLVELVLDDVGVGPGLGAPPAACLVAERGDDHHRQRSRARSSARDRLQQLEAVHLRHLDVGQHQVEVGQLGDPPQRLAPVAGDLDP